MITARFAGLFAVIVVLGSLVPLYYHRRHQLAWTPAGAPARAEPILCMSDCTSRDGLCVDWHSRLCKYVDGNGCCTPATTETQRPSKALRCERDCCTKSYAECVGWCVSRLMVETSAIPQVSFGACRDECRLSGRSWYGERWFNQSGTGGIYRSEALHCFMRIPRTAPPLTAPDRPRTMPPRPTRPARPTAETTQAVGAPVTTADNDTTVRYIEFH